MMPQPHVPGSPGAEENLLGSTPTDRGKLGAKQSLLVEADGGPLAVVVAGANLPDAQLLEATVDATVLVRPEPEVVFPQHLCLDKGYGNPTGWGACIDRNYVLHIALIRDERPPQPRRHKAGRWVVERTLAWLSKCRGLLVRYEKKSENYLGLLKLGCCLVWFRRYLRLTSLR